MNPIKTSINLIVIKADKLQEQFEFYLALGLQFEYHRHGDGPHHYASMGAPPVIEIYPLSKGVQQPDHTTRLGFTVEKLDELIRQLQDKGVRIITAPEVNEWGYGAVVQDMDGRKIELIEGR